MIYYMELTHRAQTNDEDVELKIEDDEDSEDDNDDSEKKSEVVQLETVSEEKEEDGSMSEQQTEDQEKEMVQKEELKVEAKEAEDEAEEEEELKSKTSNSDNTDECSSSQQAQAASAEANAEAAEAEATEFPDTTLSMNFSSARGLEFKAVAPSNFPSQVDSATSTTTAEAAAASTNSDETTTAGGCRPSFSRQETAKHKKKSKRDQQQNQSSTSQGNSTLLGKFFFSFQNCPRPIDYKREHCCTSDWSCTALPKVDRFELIRSNSITFPGILLFSPPFTLYGKQSALYNYVHLHTYFEWNCCQITLNSLLHTISLFQATQNTYSGRTQKSSLLFFYHQVRYIHPSLISNGHTWMTFITFFSSSIFKGSLW